MKYLIVNADDFGASRGINRGILEAHQRGILTSTSLLVNTPWSAQAAELSRTVPGLSVGLHADLQMELSQLSTDSERLREALRGQFRRFEELMSRPPTHLDSHHNVHRDARALPYFLELADEYELPLREHSPVGYFSSFYGRWSGETHLERISVESLQQMLAVDFRKGFTELSCHPGYVDPDYSSGYTLEREAELRTLCDPRIRLALAVQALRLVSYHDLARLVASASA